MNNVNSTGGIEFPIKEMIMGLIPLLFMVATFPMVLDMISYSTCELGLAANTSSAGCTSEQIQEYFDSKAEEAQEAKQAIEPNETIDVRNVPDMPVGYDNRGLPI